MKKLRICVGSNDGTSVAKSHMGDTETFHIYDLSDNGTTTFIEERKNIAREMEHDTANKMKQIISLVKDAEVFVAKQKSPNFINIAKKTSHQPVVVTADTISHALVLISSSFETIHTYTTRRANGEKFETVLELSE